MDNIFSNNKTLTEEQFKQFQNGDYKAYLSADIDNGKDNAEKYKALIITDHKRISQTLRDKVNKQVQDLDLMPLDVDMYQYDNLFTGYNTIELDMSFFNKDKENRQIFNCKLMGRIKTIKLPLDKLVLVTVIDNKQGVL